MRLMAATAAAVALAAPATSTAASSSSSNSREDVPPWKNPSLPIAERANDLISRLTLAEAIGQLSNSQVPFLDQPRYEYGQECLAGFQGASLWASPTRVTAVNSSAFPHAVSLGMSLDPALVRSVAAAIGTEARAVHNGYGRPTLTCNSPVLNVARDPRWGRCMETYGEDPTVIAKLGAAYVRGIQHGDVGAPETDVLLVAASPKHFADYNLECYCFPNRPHSACNASRPEDGCWLPDGIGRNAYDASVSAHDMRETYLAGWRAAAAEGAQGAMCSSNAVNGVPLCAHKDLLSDILKGEFGMSGAVISDGNGVADIFRQPNPKIRGHEYAHDYPHAAADAVNAGCDMSWDGNLNDTTRYGAWPGGILARALAANLTTEAAVRLAAKNTLLPRFRVGLFDPPGRGGNPWASIPVTAVLSREHVALAARAAAGSHTLLKNANGSLPLRNASEGGPSVVAVVGAAAYSAQLSVDRYSGTPSAQATSTYHDGILARAAAGGATVVGCQGAHGGAAACAAHLASVKAEAVVVVATGVQEGEQHDRAELGLRPDQLQLAQAVRAALPEATVVLVVVAGGAVSTERAEPLVQATVWAGKAGMQAGAGFASLLYGDVDFSGRVAATVYTEKWASASSFLDSGVSAAHPPRGYRYLGSPPDLVQHSFGHGLSYRAYTAAADRSTYVISADELRRGGNVSVVVTVTAGASDTTDGARSVLLFLSHADGGGGAGGGHGSPSGHVPSEAPPGPDGLPRRIEWLADFDKAHFPRGGATTATVRLSVGADELGRWVPASGGAAATDFVKGAYTVVPGVYSVRVTDSYARATITVTA